MNLEEFSQLMALVGGAIDRNPATSHHEAWWEAFSEESYEIVRLAAKRVIEQQQETRRWPAVRDVRDEIRAEHRRRNPVGATQTESAAPTTRGRQIAAVAMGADVPSPSADLKALAAARRDPAQDFDSWAQAYRDARRHLDQVRIADLASRFGMTYDAMQSQLHHREGDLEPRIDAAIEEKRKQLARRSPRSS